MYIIITYINLWFVRGLQRLQKCVPELCETCECATQVIIQLLPEPEADPNYNMKTGLYIKYRHEHVRVPGCSFIVVVY